MAVVPGLQFSVAAHTAPDACTGGWAGIAADLLAGNVSLSPLARQLGVWGWTQDHYQAAQPVGRRTGGAAPWHTCQAIQGHKKASWIMNF